MFFKDFGGSKNIEIDETFTNIESGVLCNTKKPAGPGKIGWIGCTSGQCEPNGGPMEVPMAVRGVRQGSPAQKKLSEPGPATRVS